MITDNIKEIIGKYDRGKNLHRRLRIALSTRNRFRRKAGRLRNRSSLPKRKRKNLHQILPKRL